MHLSSKLLILLLALGIQADEYIDHIGYAEYPDVRFELYKTPQCKSVGIEDAVLANFTIPTDGLKPSDKVYKIRSWRATQLDYDNNGLKCYAELERGKNRASKTSGSGILTPGKKTCIDLPNPIRVRSPFATHGPPYPTVAG